MDFMEEYVQVLGANQLQANPIIINSKRKYLKCHIIIHHYPYFFKTSGKNMKLTNGEIPESCHSTLRQSEENYVFKTKRKLGSPMHQQKSWQSLTLYNSKRAGHNTPLRLKKKSLSQSPFTTSTPFSKHFLERFPEAVERHNVLIWAFCLSPKARISRLC